MEITTLALFELSHSLAGDYLRAFTYPWEALGGIGEFLNILTETLDGSFLKLREGVFVHGTAKIARTAEIMPPCLICAGAQVRSGAFIRGNVLVGRNAVVGNSTELKNCILFDEVEVPHYNYVGDSILGWRAHLGAGAVCSNVRLDKGEVVVHGGHRTGRRKVGAFVGDGAQVGCNSVLAPGCVLPRGARVLPLTFVRGFFSGEAP